MSSNGVLGELVDWFLGRAGDRRQYKRRSVAFHVWWQAGPPPDGMRQAIGTEISPNGMVFIIADSIPNPEFNLVLRLEDKKMPVRVRSIRSDRVQHNGKTWNRHMCEFTGIAADNWDRIVRYVNHEDDPEERRKNQNQEMQRQPDDAYRLLPLAIQEKIVAMLVEKHRLEAPQAGQTPLLKLFYGGLVKRAGKSPAHRINVHSRILINDELVAYDTRFLVEDSGVVTFA
ncbi:MAG: hypothetical protein JO199_01800 [Candidatus Eremiobacteraeota bacterium]|nr:hypothetical protein [Candidatus Eremiobacteraeota bacterium]